MRGTSRDWRTDFALVLHFHQPVGNFDHVVARVTDRCYEPLLRILAEFPSVRTHLHFNGILLEWFDRNRPELVEIIAGLVSSGSVELLTGGMREPILGVLPENDAIAQVRELSDDLHRRFGQRPQGAWLTERVFEPRLPTPLFRAGVRYVTLDDVIFRWAGLEEDQLHGAWLTDDAGHPLVLFPASKRLRYTIPFHPPEDTLALLRERPDSGSARPLHVYADDAEKFGEWPGTHEWVWEKGWLKDFLEQLSRAEDVRTVHLAQRLDEVAPLGRIYPPAASYPEMTMWALPTPARARLETLVHDLEEDDPREILPELRGGHWRGFLAKYPEAHRLHKRMLRVSRRLAAARQVRDDPDRLAALERELHRGQCNDAYWHGAFGGLYLPHLRRAVEASLIRTERELDRVEETAAGARMLDVDADGHDEIELLSAAGRLHVDPANGSVLAWDLLGAAENWVSVMQRHEEPFHANVRSGNVVAVDEEGIPLAEGEEEGATSIHGAVRVKPGVSEADLAVDRHTRIAGILWWGDAPEDPRRVEDDARPVGGPWEAACAPDRPACTLRRRVRGTDLVQSYSLDADRIAVEWQLEIDPGGEPVQLHAEWNLFVGWTGDDLECDDGGSWVARPAGSARMDSELRFRGGGGRALTLRGDADTRVGWAPVHTVSSSEGGLEKIGQGTCFLFSWKIEGARTIRLRFEASSPDDHAPLP